MVVPLNAIELDPLYIQNPVMKYNRLVLKGDLKIKKIRPPGVGAFLAGPYSVFLPTIGVVGGADPTLTETDGFTDITAQIAAEIGDIVTLTGNTEYIVNQAIQIPAGKRVQAADGESVTIKRADGYSGNMIEMGTSSAFSNITLDGNFENNAAAEGLAGASAVHVNGDANCIVEHCTFINHPSNGVYSDQCDNVTIQYNIFSEVFFPIYVDGGSTGNAAGTITGNNCTNSIARRSMSSIHVDDATAIQIFHNTVTGAGTLAPTSPGADGTWGVGIILQNCPQFHAENNTCGRSRWAGFIANGSENGTAKHNYFTHGAALASIAGALVGAWMVNDSDNCSFTLNMVDGIVQVDSEACSILENIVNALGSTGIDMDAGATVALVQGNLVTRVSGSATNGIVLFDKTVPAVNMRVLNNTITGFAVGISINNTGGSGTVFGITATGNVFTGNTNNYNVPAAITLHVSCVLEGYSAEPPAPVPPPPPSGPTESAHNSTIPPFTSITDSTLATWAVQGGVIFRNGVQTISSSVTLLLYYNGIIYQQNSFLAWWFWNNINSAWVATSDPRVSAPAPSPSPVPVPVISNVAKHPRDWLQIGTAATGAYYVESNPWNNQGIQQGSASNQYEQRIERQLQVGSGGEVAARFTWSWPLNSGDSIKSYPAIIYGAKPGYNASGSRWPAFDFAARLPDGVAVPTPPSGTPSRIATGADDTGPSQGWSTVGGSVSTNISNAGQTPGSNLPLTAPYDDDEVVLTGRMTAVATTGKGHICFDCWLQAPEDSAQKVGFKNSPITHEIMVSLKNWGDYGRHPNGSNQSWYDHDVVIDGITWHVYISKNIGTNQNTGLVDGSNNPGLRYNFGGSPTSAGLNAVYVNEETGGFRRGWKFIRFVPDGTQMPLDSNGKFNVNLGKMLNHLATRTDQTGVGLVRGTEHLVSIEVGPEIANGAGDVTIYDYKAPRPTPVIVPVNADMAGASSATFAQPLPSISITDRGAIANAATNNIAAIRNAISAAALTGHKTVWIPPGTYGYSGVISVPAAVTLMGAGLTSVLHALDPTNRCVRMFGNGPVVKQFKLTGNFTGVRTAPWEHVGVVPDGCTNFLVENIFVDGGDAAGMQTAHQPSFGTVRSCTSRNTKADSYHFENGPHHILIELCYAENSGDDGIASITYETSPATARNIEARYNRINGVVAGRAFSMVGSQDIYYHHNRIDSCTPAAGCYIAQENSFVTLGNTNCRFEFNTMVDCGNVGAGHAAIMIFSDGAHPNTNITILRNSITPNGGRNGIRTFGPQTGVQLTSNRITNAGTDYVNTNTAGVATVLWTNESVGHLVP